MKSWVAKISLVIAYTFFYDCRQILSSTYTFELVPKGLATDPSILLENKTNFPCHKLPYVLYDKMVCWHIIFCLSIYHLLLHTRKGCLFWVCQPWYNWLILGIINKKQLKKKSWLLQCRSDVKLCILKLPSSSYCNNCSLIQMRMSIFLLI